MLGTAVIGGMTAASFIAIFMIPVTFVVVERLSHRFSRKSAVAPQISGEPEGVME
jgi:HAE1 family hydrophobic/amphiphilic exporter-1